MFRRVMQLYFARHAQSYNNSLEGRADYYARRDDDPPLTERGQQQAACLAALLAGNPAEHARARSHRHYRNPWNHEGFHLTHIYCSLQRRAVETARAIAARVDVPVVGWSQIHECGGVVRYVAETESFTGAPGARVADLREWFPALVMRDEIHPDGWWNGRPMERGQEPADRARGVCREILERHGGTDDHVLLVSHSMFYVYFMCEVLGLQFRSELWFSLNNAALTRLDIGDGEDFEPGIDAGRRRLSGLPVRVAYANRQDHIPLELVS